MISRRCLICANINPCSRHSDADQRAELARNDAAIAEIRGSRIKPAAPSGEASPLSAELGSTGTDRGRDEQLSRLQHSLSLAVEALRFYGSEPNWSYWQGTNNLREHSPAMLDQGKLAREVHSKLTESE